LQELTGYWALWKDKRTLRFASPKIQVCSGSPLSIQQTQCNTSTIMSMYLNLGILLLEECVTLMKLECLEM